VGGCSRTYGPLIKSQLLEASRRSHCTSPTGRRSRCLPFMCAAMPSKTTSSDGIVEEIPTAISSLPWLFVGANRGDPERSVGRSGGRSRPPLIATALWKGVASVLVSL